MRTTTPSKHHHLLLVALAFLTIAIVTLAAPRAFSASPVPPAPSGNCITLISENFDSTQPGTIPQGWLASFTPGGSDCVPTGTCTLGSNWTTIAGAADSAPNAAFHDDPSCVTDSTLDTLFFTIPASTGARVTFRHSFNTELNFDGGVLEISTPAAGFRDILAAGGSFVIGGYSSTISTAFLSPISGRQAWSGNSNGFVTTIADLPASLAGLSVKLRFRMASDCNVSSSGWTVDNVTVTAGACPLPSPTPSCTPPSEGFDDITTLVPSGWFMQNNSMPGPGTTNWFQGNTAVFSAQAGAGDSYISANFNNGTGASTLSNWLLTPPLLLQGGPITFYTRTVDVPQFADRLQVRVSFNGASTNVGTTETSVGDFTTLLLDINANYVPSGYPNVWTQFTANLALPAPTMGRIAFRYFVENGGPTGTNSDYIGIDSLSIPAAACSGVTTPTPTPPSQTPTPPSQTPTPTVAPTVSPTPAQTITPTPTPSASPVIVSPLIASGFVNRPFVYQFESVGAEFLDAANLPSGLKFDAFLSAITGIPSATGEFLIDLTARNGLGTTTATLTLTIQPLPTAGPVITSATAVTGRVGQPFTFHVITINGSPAARLNTDNLPPGLNADAVTGVISGTPTAAGSFAVFLSVSDGNFTTNEILEVTISPDPGRPIVISPDTAPLTLGQPFFYLCRAATSSTEKTVWTLLGGLPGGLGFDPVAGTISGTWLPRPGGGDHRPDLAGGALVGSVQLFGTNSNGSGTIQLLFLQAPSGLVNISTRMLVGTGDNVLIGGFIVAGNAPKVVITRGLGPSLTSAGISGALPDPTLELNDSAHPNIVVNNNNWRDTQQQAIQDTGIAPTNNLESAIVVAIDPGSYTAILRGNANATGVAVVEVYDLGTASVDASSTARLAQISTRGTVLTGDNVMIGGFIIAGSATNVIVRAIGPELNGVVPGPLQDTVLELRDGEGALLASNDDWRSTQEQEIINTGVPPTDDREAAIVATLNPGAYTGIVRGKNATTGAALVEIYGLQTGGGLESKPH